MPGQPYLDEQSAGLTTAPNLLVAGLGRCGTTMMMTMLDAGGFPVAGPRPSYELPECWPGLRPDMDWLRAQGGRAVKWLDPTRSPTLPGRLAVPPVVILMTRNAREQARSQVKMVELGVHSIRFGRHGVKSFERSIRRDTPVMRALLRNRAIVHEFRFENILAAPLAASARLGEILADEFGTLFDAGRAARVVIGRRPECLPHMHMEAIVQPAIAAELAGEGAV